MSDLKKGDLVTGRGFVESVCRNGMDGEIISDITFNQCRSATDGRKLPASWKFEVMWADGDIRWVEPERLVKKKPPQREQDQIVSWDDCLWKPKEVVTV